MTTLSYTVPTPGSTLNQIADPEIATALTSILNWSVNIDSGNVTSTFAPAAGVNQSGQTVKGAATFRRPRLEAICVWDAHHAGSGDGDRAAGEWTAHGGLPGDVAGVCVVRG